MHIKGVTDSVTLLLREKIITGVLHAGEKLHELDLSEQMGVSRPPLREAFRKLEYENLVVNIPRKGTYVADMSMEDCDQVYYSRQVLENAAIAFFQEHNIRALPLAEKALTDSTTATPPNCGDSQQIYTYYLVMAAFHKTLVESCKNSWLTHCYLGICSSLARYQVLYLTIPGSGKTSISEHGRILDLICDGQYKKARFQLNAHIHKTLERLKKKMRRQTPSPKGA